MKKKKLILFSIVFAFSAVFYFLYKKNGDESSLGKSQNKPSSSMATAGSKEQAKENKALKKTQKKKLNKKEASTSDDQGAHRKVANTPLSRQSPSAPSRPKRWARVLSERLSSQLKHWDVNPQIKSLGSRTYRRGFKDQEVEHVLISIDKGDGNVSSYEAYVNSKTGSILKTWNQTRFEQTESVAYKMRAFKTTP